MHFNDRCLPDEQPNFRAFQANGSFVPQSHHPTPSHAEVIRRALQLYGLVIEEEEKGGGVSKNSVEDGEIIYRSIF